MTTEMETPRMIMRSPKCPRNMKRFWMKVSIILSSFVREFEQGVSVAGLWSAPAGKIFAFKLFDLGHEFVLLDDPFSVFTDHFFSVPIFTD